MSGFAGRVIIAACHLSGRDFEQHGKTSISVVRSIRTGARGAVPTEELSKYRDHLVLAEQKAQEDFDKTVLSLSGGALGVSFAFVTDVVGNPPFKWPLLLFWAWICWGSSVFSALASYFTSHLALRTAIRQVDTNQIYSGKVGGAYDVATAVLNGLGAVLFLAGLY